MVRPAGDREPVGDFYVHLIRGTTRDSVDRELTSSTKLLRKSGKPTVISFYNDGCGGCRPCAAQMRHWASMIPDVQFLEVCVESEDCALRFHRDFRFGDNPVDRNNDNDIDNEPVVVNGFIPSRPYFPVGYGQLGCSGFVISDANGNFVSRKTAAYLQYGQDAFRHVESILSGLLVEMEDDRRKKEASSPSAGVIDRGMSSKSVSPIESDRKKQKINSAATSVTDDSSSSSSSSRGNDTGSPTTVLGMEAPASVGVDAMDDEHQICTDSFNRALRDPTFETLQEVFDLLHSHFAHEEELIAKYYGISAASESPFSALSSHRKDHQKMLAMASSEMRRVSVMHASAASCSTTGACRRPGAAPEPPPPETPIDRRVLEALIGAFHRHAETFDSLYHDKIPTGAE